MSYTFFLSCVTNKSMQIIWNRTVRPKMYLRWPINSINYSNLVTYREKVLFDEVKKGIDFIIKNSKNASQHLFKNLCLGILSLFYSNFHLHLCIYILFGFLLIQLMHEVN